MRFKILSTCFFIGCLAVSTSTAQTRMDPLCSEVSLPLQVKVVSSPDLYRAANVDAGHVFNVQFANGPSPITGRKIVQIDPLISASRFDDGSGIQFLSAKGDGHITGATYVRSTKCWMDEGNFSFEKPVPGRTDEVILSDSPSDLPRATLRLENRRGFGRLAHVLQFPNKSPAETQVIEPLIVTDRPIEAFGVSVPSIEGGWRTLMIVMREDDGSLTVASYAFSRRNWVRKGT